MGSSKTSIVVVPREQFSVAARSLESILAHTAEAYELIYVDGNSPSSVRRYLERRSQEVGFRLLRTDHYLTPNQARNLSLEHLRGDFVVFVDNDLIVSPGWLGSLIRCAEETGAWAVGPLYLEGDPADRVIHMAGGTFSFHGERPHRRFDTVHELQKQRIDDLPAPLSRVECDFVEFHCMLLRRKVLDTLAPFDEELMNSREHLDLCLAIKAAGGAVLFEPEAVVTYRSPPPLAASDIPYFLLRWSDEWTRRSLRRFVDKHGLHRSYLERAHIAASRRAVVFHPLTRATGTVFGSRPAKALSQVLQRLETTFNRLLVSGRAR
jgi:GT2 family glycosyltransferase